MKTETKDKWSASRLLALAYLTTAGFSWIEGVEDGVRYATPKNPRITELYGDERPEIVVNSNGKDFLFTQDENGKYSPLEEVMEREKLSAIDEAERSYDSQFSQIEQKLQGGNN